jgi:glycosyltransferase involved in cell wall biosynthesis
MSTQRPPAISIGMPTYNGERFIERAIESVLQQTFTDFELIISDNASTDRTGEICAGYAQRDARVRYIRLPENKGASFNFTHVLDQARAPYFSWAADDDERNDEYYERLLARMAPDVVLAFGTLEVIDAEGCLLRRHPPFAYDAGPFARSLRYYMDPETSGKACLIYGLFQAESIRSIPIQPYYGCLYGTDMHIMFDIMQRGRIAIEPGAVFRARTYTVERHRSTGWVRDNSGQPLAKRIWRRVDQLLLLRAPRYIAVYPLIARGTLLRVALALLVPVKYLRVLAENMVTAGNALATRLRREWGPGQDQG